MSVDQSYVERNRAATQRIRDLVARLSDADMQKPVGEHWTVSVALAHLAFWDGRVLAVLDASEKAGNLAPPTIDVVVNDISLALWRAVPPGEAARIAIETADKLDQRLEALSPAWVEQLAAFNMRFLVRALHRNEHLDEVDAALKG
ncbi:MAG: maleylpyruvate isomerase N-terminal domain-containing protein [Anaerolineae bacterium]|nr:maleylpyruvate isomerase N-terminal domain-containing protein [Anaerolineae bacterium]